MEGKIEQIFTSKIYGLELFELSGIGREEIEKEEL